MCKKEKDFKEDRSGICAINCHEDSIDDGFEDILRKIRHPIEEPSDHEAGKAAIEKGYLTFSAVDDKKLLFRWWDKKTTFEVKTNNAVQCAEILTDFVSYYNVYRNDSRGDRNRNDSRGDRIGMDSYDIGAYFEGNKNRKIRFCGRVEYDEMMAFINSANRRGSYPLFWHEVGSECEPEEELFFFRMAELIFDPTVEVPPFPLAQESFYKDSNQKSVYSLLLMIE